jgi:hypothetical protein
MTLTYLLLAAGFLAVPFSIGVDIWSDNRGLPPLGYARALHRQSELARLTAPLPAPRASLLPLELDWPRPLSPLDLPGIGHTAELAAVQLSSRVFVAEDVPIVVQLAVEGRHHIGVAPGTREQRARWNTPTGQFWAIVEDLRDLDEPCSHCTTPEDGEPAHAACPGCACPCGSAVAV